MTALNSGVADEAGPTSVVVVGAGYTGTALAIQLLRRLPDGSAVTLVAGPGEPGRGIAYGTTDAGHLLNVQAGRMSLDPDDAGDFVRWLEGSGHAAAVAAHAPSLPEAYVPRPLYGNYLQARLAEAIAEHAGRVRIAILRATAESAERGPDGWLVRLDDGSAVRGEVLALCLGNVGGGLPLPPGRVDPAVLGRVVADPWSAEAAAIGPDEDVLVIGTGLTMVDRARTRSRLGHTGRTVAVSRRGLLPLPHVPTLPAAVPTPAATEAVGLLGLTRAVRASLAAHAAEGGDWRSVVDGLRPVTQRLWAGLTPRERASFLRHLNVHWNVARHRIAPEVAAEIAAMREAGRLEVVAARVESLTATGDGRVLAQFRQRGGGTREETFDRVLSCAGLERNPAASGSPLLADLLAAGAVRPDSTGLGLGIDVADEGWAVDADGRSAADLLVLGPVTVGRFWEIVAVPDLRVQVARAAAAVAVRVPSVAA